MKKGIKGETPGWSSSSPTQCGYQNCVKELSAHGRVPGGRVLSKKKTHPQLTNKRQKRRSTDLSFLWDSSFRKCYHLTNIVAVKLLNLRRYKAVQTYLPRDRFHQQLYERFSSLPFLLFAVYVLFISLIVLFGYPKRSFYSLNSKFLKH